MVVGLRIEFMKSTRISPRKTINPHRAASVLFEKSKFLSKICFYTLINSINNCTWLFMTCVAEKFFGNFVAFLLALKINKKNESRDIKNSKFDIHF